MGRVTDSVDGLVNGPGNAGATYGIVRLRIVFDDKRAEKGEDFIVYQVYDPQRQDWVEVGKDAAEDIAERGKLVGGGLLPNGFHFIEAIPRHRLGVYEKYVVEWVEKKDLPKDLLIINEGIDVRVYYIASGSL